MRSGVLLGKATIRVPSGDPDPLLFPPCRPAASHLPSPRYFGDALCAVVTPPEVHLYGVLNHDPVERLHP